MPTEQRIALFGGSFDPVHLGHVAIAGRAMKSMELDQVRFIPCEISPHKLDSKPTPGSLRVAMLEVALEGMDWAVIDPIELNHSGPSYSYLTAQNIHERHPEARLFWIVGNDQWDALPRWKNPQQLAELVEFIVFTRGGSPRPREGWVMHHLDGTHPASSTRIRHSIAQGLAPTESLNAGVLEFIMQHGLYLP